MTVNKSNESPPSEHEEGEHVNPETETEIIKSTDLKIWFQLAYVCQPGSWKLLWDLTQWALDYGSLLVSLILSLLNEKTNENILWTLITHIISCVIILIIDVTSLKRPSLTPKSTTRYLRRQIERFTANIFMVLKPIRLINRYFYRKKASRLIRDHLKLRMAVDEQEVQTVVCMIEKEMRDDYYHMIIVFIQTVPLALLQMALLFKSKQTLQICSTADLSRMIMIFATVFSTAKATADYSYSYNKYILSLHFMDYFLSGYKQSHEMNIISIANRFTYLFNLLCNMLLSVHRFYTISFLLAVNYTLPVIFVVSTFMSQMLLIVAFPSLRYRLENPPFGVYTLFSNIFDRWTNVFTMHMLNFNSLSSKRFKIQCKFQIPCSLLHLITFVVSIGIVLVMVQTTGNLDDYIGVYKSVMPALQNRSNTSAKNFIPCANERFQSNVEWIQFIGDLILKSHNAITNRFHSFNDLFGMIHFLPFSFYAYVCLATTYSYYLHWFMLDDSKFPVQIALTHWRKLLLIRDEDEVIKMMILTIVNDKIFNQMVRRKLLCRKMSIENYVDFLGEFKMKGTEEEIHRRITSILKEHKTEMSELYSFLSASERKNDMGKRIFFVFILRFYHQLRLMSSRRIKNTYWMLSIDMK